jgi:hypothetical protein
LLITTRAQLLEIEASQSMHVPSASPPFDIIPQETFQKRLRDAGRNVSVTLLKLHYYQKHRKKLKIIV